MLVREQPVQFQVDCAASANILPLKYAEGEEFDSCSQMLVMWNGTKVTPYKVRFLVVKEDLTPLLGLNATEKMKLLTVHKKNFIKEAVSRQSRNVHLQVDPDCKPVILPARKVPVSVQLQRLERLKVIIPVDEPTEGVSQIVVAV
ncbi:unnamed protein product, partial [Porites lobata]